MNPASFLNTINGLGNIGFVGLPFQQIKIYIDDEATPSGKILIEPNGELTLDYSGTDSRVTDFHKMMDNILQHEQNRIRNPHMASNRPEHVDNGGGFRFMKTPGRSDTQPEPDNACHNHTAYTNE